MVGSIMEELKVGTIRKNEQMLEQINRNQERI